MAMLSNADIMLMSYCTLRHVPHTSRWIDVVDTFIKTSLRTVLSSGDKTNYIIIHSDDDRQTLRNDNISVNCIYIFKIK